MIRLLAALWVLVLAAPAWSGPLTRITTTPLDGAHALVGIGTLNPALVALRTGMAPLRSFDGGVTWTPFTVQGEFPQTVVGSSADSRTWYARVPNANVYVTRNGGDTWQMVEAFRFGVAVGADPSVIYGFMPTEQPGPQKLRVSRDGGATYVDRILDFALGGGSLTVSPVDSSIAYLRTVFDIYRTGDYGATWTKLARPTPRPGVGQQMAPILMAVDRKNPAIAYASYVLTDHPSYVTIDGGQTWSEVPAGFEVSEADPLTAGRAYATGRAGTLETRDAGRTWTVVDPTGLDGPILTDGTRRVAVSLSLAKLNQLDITHGALALGSDLWWNPAESGTGFTITQHASNRPFVVWYAYDAAGAPVWRVMPGGTWNDRTLTGPMYETTGPAFFRENFDPTDVTIREVGTATLRFTDDNNALFTLAAGGSRVEKAITRQLFAPSTQFSVDTFADLWWSPQESGWGMAINHQSNRIFATWYVYGDDGKPLWIVMPDAVMSQEFVGPVVRPVATGELYATRGPAAGAPYDPAQVVATRVGTATIHFRDAGAAELEFTAFGRTERKAITRQAF